MKLLIDDANVDKIREICEYYPIDGVTTNPSILAKVGKKPYEVLKEIRSIIGEDLELHVQVISKDANGMVEEAKKIIAELGSSTFVKVPSIKEGFKAMKELKTMGINITATAIYSPMQAFLAAQSGAYYVAPYINRIDNLGYDGVETTKKIQDILENNGLSTKILAASFKNSAQVLALVHYGVGAATISCDVIESLVSDKNVESAVRVFIEDFEGLLGENKTML